MLLVINDNNEIIEYATTGDLSGAIEYNGVTPAGFEDSFKPKYYRLINNQIEVNPDYSEPIVNQPKQGLTKQDEINAQFFKMNLDLQLKLKELKSNG